MRRKSEKGAALVLALLLLMIFTALSLNMFFMSERRNRIALTKKEEARELARVDTGLNIGYFEGSISREFAITGVTPGGVHATVGHEIRLNNNYDWFTNREITTNSTIVTMTAISTLAASGTTTVTRNAFTASLYDGTLTTRAGIFSMGGYERVSVSTQVSIAALYQYDDPATTTSDETCEELYTSTTTIPAITTNFIKKILVQGSADTGINIRDMYYNIDFTYRTKITPRSTTTGTMSLDESGDGPMSLTITYIRN